MNFRTEIEPMRGVAEISHGNSILMLGSCFTTNIGEQLAADGFNVTVNPTGTLYNPASIASLIRRASASRLYTHDDLLTDTAGIHHALDFPNICQSPDPDALLADINGRLLQLAEALHAADTVIVTFGTAYVFELLPQNQIVGNCHKLPADRFRRRALSIDEIVRLWHNLIPGKRTIFTVSPIRHMADGLHGNTLSKATLLLAVDALCRESGEYFPSYEIMMDDLRDYRFYAADMKHPSATAVEYIYSRFAETYFSKATAAKAAIQRKAFIHSQHRQLL